MQVGWRCSYQRTSRMCALGVALSMGTVVGCASTSGPPIGPRPSETSVTMPTLAPLALLAVATRALEMRELAEVTVVKLPTSTVEPAAEATPKDASPTAPPAEPAVLAIAYVSNTDGEGVFLRRTPDPDDRLSPWPDGSRFEVLEGGLTVGGKRWAAVRAPDGQRGWVPNMYLADRPPATPTPRPTVTPTPRPPTATPRAPTATPRSLTLRPNRPERWLPSLGGN